MIKAGRNRLSPTTSLAVASAVTTVLLAAAAVMRFAVVDPPGTPLPDRLGGLLVGTAFLLTGLLALPRTPRLAWAGVAVAATIGALEVVAVVRSLEPVVSGGPWRDLVFIAALALIGGVLVATGYATGNPERASAAARIATLIVGIGVVSTTLAAVWAVVEAAGPRVDANSAGELTPLRIAARIALATMAGAFAVGVARHLGPPAKRAADRLRAIPAELPGGRLWQYLGLLADELVPARGEGRRRSAEEERARLAADLHALVLPELRRAAASAASAGAPPGVQVDLRRALEDVEQLMHQRQSVVLEQFGLVAALEWLAERTEERSPIRIRLELDGDVPNGPDAVDRDVARAAFRIALLALDNVVRHASASEVTLRLSTDQKGLHLIVEDDGRASGTFEEGTGRGLVDMRSEAAASGGSIAIAGAAGAQIVATWPPRGRHAVSPARSRSSAPGRRRAA